MSYDNFVKLKNFSEKTLTKEFIIDLCSLIAWSELSKKDYKNDDMYIVKDMPCQGVSKTGKGYIYPWDDSKKDLYDKIETGVEITIPITKQVIKLWNTGRIACFYGNNSLSEYEYICRNKNTGQESYIEQMNYPPPATSVVDLLIKHGFIKLK